MSAQPKRTLYGYWRSSASYRVRIALNLKGLDYTHQSVHLVKNEQRQPDFLNKNPQGLIPLYVEEDSTGRFELAQSLAIMDYLEMRYPDKPLLPADMHHCAKLRAAAFAIACDIHPLDNLRVLNYLEQQLGVEAEAKMTWYRHWITTGFQALERELPALLNGQTFSLGERPGYFEAVLVPQVYNAKRFDCVLDDFPNLLALNDACMKLPAFIAASPEKQPDAQ
ncbi:MAG: maleylacetoacetate isomerase [Gammaproteobacteria bacterium]|nr:MAG: maleylacetoacetate isomerase [Gammaproteobacteria bacterium]